MCQEKDIDIFFSNVLFKIFLATYDYNYALVKNLLTKMIKLQNDIKSHMNINISIYLSYILYKYLIFEETLYGAIKMLIR